MTFHGVRDDDAPEPRARRWRRKLAAIAIVVATTTATLLVAGQAPASAADGCADSVNSFRTWEDWIGGARVHASAKFQPSHTCSDGRHVKKAYVRIVRQCGPKKDTGRVYSQTASSSRDTTTYTVSAWIFDSVLWGCQTNTYYGFEYF
jgi:hypothetical protein